MDHPIHIQRSNLAQPLATGVGPREAWITEHDRKAGIAAGQEEDL